MLSSQALPSAPAPEPLAVVPRAESKPIVTAADFLHCAICKRLGREEYANANDYLDELDSPLEDAGHSATGAWVCSRACLAQLMFESAGVSERAALKRVELALRTLEDDVFGLRETLETWGMYGGVDAIPGAVRELREAMGVDSKPKWIAENEAVEDKLARDIRTAVSDLWKPLVLLRVELAGELALARRSFFSPTEEDRAKRLSETLASLDGIAVRLKTAVDEVGK